MFSYLDSPYLCDGDLAVTSLMYVTGYSSPVQLLVSTVVYVESPYLYQASLVAYMVKNPPITQKTWV